MSRGSNGGRGGRGGRRRSDQEGGAAEVGDNNVLIADVGGREVEIATQREFEDRDVSVDEAQEGRECPVLAFGIPHHLCSSTKKERRKRRKETVRSRSGR